MTPVAVPHALFEQKWPEGQFCYFQMGFVVDDIGAAAHDWARVFGVGPFFVNPPVDARWRFQGHDAEVTMQIATSWAGPVQIELVKQHCERPSIFGPPLWAGSTGFHQVCTVTPDFDAKKRHYQSLGYEAVAEITGPLRVAYYDTYRDFGFFTEVVEDTPGFLEQRAALAAICAQWDGSDPVRQISTTGTS